MGRQEIIEKYSDLIKTEDDIASHKVREKFKDRLYLLLQESLPDEEDTPNEDNVLDRLLEQGNSPLEERDIEKYDFARVSENDPPITGVEIQRAFQDIVTVGMNIPEGYVYSFEVQEFVRQKLISFMNSNVGTVFSNLEIQHELTEDEYYRTRRELNRIHAAINEGLSKEQSNMRVNLVCSKKNGTGGKKTFYYVYCDIGDFDGIQAKFMREHSTGNEK